MGGGGGGGAGRLEARKPQAAAALSERAEGAAGWLRQRLGRHPQGPGSILVCQAEQLNGPLLQLKDWIRG